MDDTVRNIKNTLYVQLKTDADTAILAEEKHRLRIYMFPSKEYDSGTNPQ